MLAAFKKRFGKRPTEQERRERILELFALRDWQGLQREFPHLSRTKEQEKADEEWRREQRRILGQKWEERQRREKQAQQNAEEEQRLAALERRKTIQAGNEDKCRQAGFCPWCGKKDVITCCQPIYIKISLQNAEEFCLDIFLAQTFAICLGGKLQEPGQTNPPTDPRVVGRITIFTVPPEEVEGVLSRFPKKRNVRVSDDCDDLMWSCG